MTPTTSAVWQTRRRACPRCAWRLSSNSTSSSKGTGKDRRDKIHNAPNPTPTPTSPPTQYQARPPRPPSPPPLPPPCPYPSPSMDQTTGTPDATPQSHSAPAAPRRATLSTLQSAAARRGHARAVETMPTCITRARTTRTTRWMSLWRVSRGPLGGWRTRGKGRGSGSRRPDQRCPPLYRLTRPRIPQRRTTLTKASLPPRAVYTHTRHTSLLANNNNRSKETHQLQRNCPAMHRDRGGGGRHEFWCGCRQRGERFVG